LKQPKDLSCQDLVTLIEVIQEHLYLDIDDRGRDCWNPDKSWSGDEFDCIVRNLRRHDLVPTKAELVETPGAPRKYVLYDLDEGKLIGSRVFDDPDLASQYASELSDVAIVPIALPHTVVAAAASKPEPESCECQMPGEFCCGVPGILAKVENCRVVAGAEVQRCDQCDRYPSDQAAYEKLVELGMADRRGAAAVS